MEDRTLLATMNSINPAGGDWDTASNWGNAANSSDHHVPTSSDDATISFTGITVTHVSGASDSANSLTSQASINLSSNSLSLAATSTISSNFTMSGGTLTGSGVLTISGATSGTISGTGSTTTQGGLTPGSAASTSNETLTGRTLNNLGAAPLAVGSSGTGLILGAGALFDMNHGGVFRNEGLFTDATAGTAIFGFFTGDGLFDNRGSYFKTGATETDFLTPFLNAGTVHVQQGSLSLRQGSRVADPAGVGNVTGRFVGDPGTARVHERVLDPVCPKADHSVQIQAQSDESTRYRQLVIRISDSLPRRLGGRLHCSLRRHPCRGWRGAGGNRTRFRIGEPPDRFARD
jgi:hypothetical protein